MDDFLTSQRWVGQLLTDDDLEWFTGKIGSPAHRIQGIPRDNTSSVTEHWGRVWATRLDDQTWSVFDVDDDGSSALIYSVDDLATDTTLQATGDPSGRWLYLQSETNGILRVDTESGERVVLVEPGPPDGIGDNPFWHRPDFRWSAQADALASSVCGAGLCRTDVVFPGSDRVESIDGLAAIGISSRYAIGRDTGTDGWVLVDLESGTRRAIASDLIISTAGGSSLDDTRFIISGRVPDLADGAPAGHILVVYDADTGAIDVLYRITDERLLWRLWESPEWALIEDFDTTGGAITTGGTGDIVRIRDGKLFPAAVDWSMSRP